MDELARFPDCNLTEEAIIDLVNKREIRGLDEVYNIYMGRMYYFAQEYASAQEVNEELALSSMESFWLNKDKQFASLGEVRECLFDNLKANCANALKQDEGVYLIADKKLNEEQLINHMDVTCFKAEVAFIYHIQEEKKKRNGNNPTPDENNNETPKEKEEDKEDTDENQPEK